MDRDIDAFQDFDALHNLRADVDSGVRLPRGRLRIGRHGSVSTAQRRHEKTHLWLEDLCAKADVLCLQDTYGTHEYLQTLAVILLGWNLVGIFR